MSEETLTTEAPAAAPEGAAETSQQGESVLRGDTRTTSPLDSLYQEGATADLPGNLQNLLNKYGSGIEAEKGIINMMKTASQKAPEPLGDNPTDEEKQLHSETIRKLRGVPEKAEDYEFTFPEGMNPDEEAVAKLKEFAFEKGHTAEDVNDFIPFQLELEKAGKEAALTQSIEDTYKVFESDGVDFDSVAEGLKDFMVNQGYDWNKDSTRSPEALHLAHRLQKLLGEDTHVDGSQPHNSSSTPDMKRLNELTAGETNDSKIFLGQISEPQRMFQLQHEYLELSKGIKKDA
tara:strand:- start:547 stop:1416 length:870 start_codon:yes stop_codon:yes gene_type:complete